jgi:hypothetical protein
MSLRKKATPLLIKAHFFSVRIKGSDWSKKRPASYRKSVTIKPKIKKRISRASQWDLRASFISAGFRPKRRAGREKSHRYRAINAAMITEITTRSFRKR